MERNNDFTCTGWTPSTTDILARVLNGDAINLYFRQTSEQDADELHASIEWAETEDIIEEARSYCEWLDSDKLGEFPKKVNFTNFVYITNQDVKKVINPMFSIRFDPRTPEQLDRDTAAQDWQNQITELRGGM